MTLAARRSLTATSRTTRADMVGHLIAEVADCGDAERDDPCQTPRKGPVVGDASSAGYVDDRKLLQPAYWRPLV
jgi:hypothetical protein